MYFIVIVYYIDKVINYAKLLSFLKFTETKLGPFWAIVLDSQKQLLLNEKFLSSVGDGGR